MNLAIEQNWHGKRNWKNADFSAGLRGSSLVSNERGVTQSRQCGQLHMEKEQRKAAIAQGMWKRPTLPSRGIGA